MKKIFVVLILMLTTSSAFAQIGADVLMLDVVTGIFHRLPTRDQVRPFEQSLITSDNATIAIVLTEKNLGGKPLKSDTLYFHRASKIGRSGFVKTGSDVSPARFAVGDSVSAMIVGGDRPYWINGKVLDKSTSGRYLIKFRDVVDYDIESKKFAYKDRREWIRESDVESYAYSKKYRSR